MILGIIPARGGSKGIPRKNIKTMCGKPLIAWSIEAASKSKLLDDFVVSTDDCEIADISRQYGAKVIGRPAELATDEATTVSVLQHVVNVLNPDIVVVLQPTSPIRDDDLIDKCISKFLETKPDNLATGYYCKMREYGTYDNLRRQDIEGFFYDDGNVYVLRRELISKGKWTGKNIAKMPISREQNYEIDDDVDFLIVEKLLEKKELKNSTNIFSDIKLIAMDVDGVLTDAGMYYSEDGNELKKFNTRDGKGIELVRNEGIKTALITQEKTKIVEKRATKLGINYVHQGIRDKVKVIEEIALKENLTMNQIAYMGDDVNDISVLKIVGASFAPNDASEEVKHIVSYIMSRKGGEGAVREMVDIILGKNQVNNKILK
ncbi:acylneuraminate cytidylyltransferase [Candidatus Pacearchaeota archaeon]|nr:acylneuraminate cytidylyltransferase [Candidatus Pacearchaeota archaeon]